MRTVMFFDHTDFSGKKTPWCNRYSEHLKQKKSAKVKTRSVLGFFFSSYIDELKKIIEMPLP